MAGRVAHRTVGDDPGGAETQRPQGEDVADRSRAFLVPRLDHEDVAGGHALDRAPLRVGLAGAGGHDVLTHGDVAQRAGRRRRAADRDAAAAVPA